jgi:putative DNA primase/helicase
MKEITFTDAHLSALFAEERLINHYLWCEGIGWMKWVGTHWTHAHISEIKDVARQWVINHCANANREYLNAKTSRNRSSDEKTKRLLDDYKSWEGYTFVGRIAALVSLAQGIVIRSIENFDIDPYALNCQNGLVDLRTGETTKHDPSMLVTKVAAADYVPDSIHPDWDKALSAIPDDVRPWMQLRFGQAITGKMTPDDVILVLQGDGQNGKSTLMEGIKSTIADYYLQVSPRALLGSDVSVPTELASFQGVRFAWLEELPRDNVLPTTRIKALAGTTDIKARHMREDDMTFPATHSLFINTNYPPTVIETDYGTWRRLALVNFPYRYRKNEKECHAENDRVGDKTIRERLREGATGQHEAILAWLIEGAIRYHQDYDAFVTLPERVESDTLNWRMTMDLIWGYIEERLEFRSDKAVGRGDLLIDFNMWLTSNGQQPLSARKFSDRFSNHEVIKASNAEPTVITNTRAQEIWSKRGPFSDIPKASTIKVWAGLAFKQDDLFTTFTGRTR